MLKEIYDIEEDLYKENEKELIELLELEELLDQPVRQLSLGQRMRCELAASLLHSPKILFLDEPTIGLDALSKLAVRKFIKKINKEKEVTVLLTTHDMDDIEELCNRVVVIGRGEILFDGPLKDLREKYDTERILKVDFFKEVERLNVSSGEIISLENQRAILKFNPIEISSSELISEIGDQFKIKDLFLENESIEEIIARFYEEVRI